VSAAGIWFSYIPQHCSPLEIRLPISFVRFTGTIVGIGASDPSGWADSKWRSLKVLTICKLFLWKQS
jgi:hypothetical protein